MTYGVGSHEPIFHRLRTGNSTAEEWDRWRQETSPENLDLLAKLGVTNAGLPCTKGFGLVAEKPLIERTVKFAGEAAKRGITTRIYTQGFPIYYETFLLEVPEAEAWFARRQDGGYIPWGGQTFRRFIDPCVTGFWEYQKRVLEYILSQFSPDEVFMDNTLCAPSYTAVGRESFRGYLRAKYDSETALREFGIPSFDAVDLPRFDPVYYPPDAMRIVKDPLLQEWARWRSRVTSEFLRQMRETVHRLSPGTRFSASAGCDGLRYNTLFNHGVDFEDRINNTDRCWMEESDWRPKVFAMAPSKNHVVMDERHPDQAKGASASGDRVSSDCRWWKLYSNYGGTGHSGFWGEVDRSGKLVTLAHHFTFSAEPHVLGRFAPLAAAPGMFDDIRDVIDWGNDHIAVLSGRTERVAPIAVWRGTSTLGFIRHKPVWEACVIEQMLLENHMPFTILLDGGLEKFLSGRKLVILPGTQCVSTRQIRILTRFVEQGGSLLLLGEAGTRDERTRVRLAYAFAHLFGKAMPTLAHIGPPHWVPELNWGSMPERMEASYGLGRVTLVKGIVPQAPLDLTRDVYMPERRVISADIVPPANEKAIMEAILSLLSVPPVAGHNGRRRSLKPSLCIPHVDGPRSTLCEFWSCGGRLLVCLANLRNDVDGGPVTIRVEAEVGSSKTCKAHSLLERQVKVLPVRNGTIRIPSVRHFVAVEFDDRGTGSK